MSCSRRATKMSLTSIGIQLLLGLTASVGFAQSTPAATSTDVAEVSPLTQRPSDDLTASGLVLPISDPMLFSGTGVRPARDLRFSAVGGDLDNSPAQPIPVPLPPGAATGAIGLVAAGIAGHYWRARRAA